MDDRLGEQPAIADRAVVIDRGFAWLQRWAIRVIAITIAAYIIGWILGHTWMIWYPVALALVVSTVLGPPASWLRRRGLPDSLAAATVMITFLGTLAALIAILTPQVAGQSDDLANQASEGLLKVRDWLVDGPIGLSEGQITRAIEALQDKLQDSASTISAGVFSTISAATSAVVNIVLILILTFLFIKDGYKFLPWAANLGGRRGGEHTVEVLSRVWGTLGGFIRTQTLVALIDAIIIGAALLIVDVPLAVPLAVITFLGGYIPIIGAFVSGILAVLVTLVTNSPEEALVIAIVVVGVQQLEGNVLSPWLQGRSMNLHSAVVLLAVTAGSSLYGITGAFLAVPVAATVAEVLRYVNERIDETVNSAAPPEDQTAAEPGPATDD